MDPSVNYALMVEERGKYPAFPFKLFFQLIGPKHAITLLVAWTGGTWVNVCWVCAAVLSEPLPHCSLFFSNYRPHLSHFLEKSNFRDPNLVTFYLCIYLINVVSRTECNAVSASLLLNLINNNFVIFF